MFNLSVAGTLNAPKGLINFSCRMSQKTRQALTIFGFFMDMSGGLNVKQFIAITQ
jgi:hypothetical protein